MLVQFSDINGAWNPDKSVWNPNNFTIWILDSSENQTCVRISDNVWKPNSIWNPHYVIPISVTCCRTHTWLLHWGQRFCVQVVVVSSRGHPDFGPQARLQFQTGSCKSRFEPSFGGFHDHWARERGVENPENEAKMNVWTISLKALNSDYQPFHSMRETVIFNLFHSKEPF